jgi:hypothetical protein
MVHFPLSPSAPPELVLPVAVTLPPMSKNQTLQQTLEYVAQYIADALRHALAPSHPELMDAEQLAAAATFSGLVLYQPQDMALLQNLMYGIVPSAGQIEHGEELCIVVHDTQPWIEAPYYATRVILRRTDAPDLHPHERTMFTLYFSRVRRALH